MARLELDGIAKRFPDGTQAVHPLSLTVPEGELLVIMGPSGCGKSTLLRLIAGLDDPTGGRVLLDGQDMTHTPPAGRDVAMVFQAYALYPHMTVAENLAFPLRMRGVPRAERDAQMRAVAVQLRLTPLLAKRPRDLSGGEQQRVALGRALIRRPRVFLLDEPLSNLDASLRGELREEIRRLHADTGITMLYVTHDQHEALALGQRVAVMRAGTLLQVDTADVLYARPAALDVAAALGHPPVNRIRGTRTIENGRPVLTTTGGNLPLPVWTRAATLPDEIVMAIRPEHVALRPAADADDSAASVTMRTVRVEGTGPDRIVWFDWCGTSWAARLAHDAAAPPRDTEVRVTIDTGGAHLFDAATGHALRSE